MGTRVRKSQPPEVFNLGGFGGKRRAQGGGGVAGAAEEEGNMERKKKRGAKKKKKAARFPTEHREWRSADEGRGGGGAEKLEEEKKNVETERGSPLWQSDATLPWQRRISRLPGNG